MTVTMRGMRLICSVILLWRLGSTLAFAPVTTTTTTCGVSRVAMASEEESSDPFEAYEQSQQQQTVAFKDVVQGTGDVLEAGQTVSVAYKGRFMSNGQEFDHSDQYACEIGAGKVIPGWDQGLTVSKE